MSGVGSCGGCGFSCVDRDGRLGILLGVGDRGWLQSWAWRGSLELMGWGGLVAWAALDQLNWFVFCGVDLAALGGWGGTLGWQFGIRVGHDWRGWIGGLE